MLIILHYGCKTTKKDVSVNLHNEVYKSACDDDIMPGCHNLAVNYLKAGDKKEAKRFFKKACDEGFSPSCSFLKK